MYVLGLIFLLNGQPTGEVFMGTVFATEEQCIAEGIARGDFLINSMFVNADDANIYCKKWGELG